tara:strand:- start:63123 stop:64865 length:1743 start_codon:yes stop_codon:yes gene_type:complete
MGVSLLGYAYNAYGYEVKTEIKLTAPHPFAGALLKEITQELNIKEKEKVKVKDISEAKRKLQDDKTHIKAYLNSQSYYNSTVQYKIVSQSKNQLSAIFYVAPQKPFYIEKLHVTTGQHTIPPNISKLPIQVGDKLLAKKVLKSEKVLAEEIELDNCLPNIEISHQAILDYKQNTAVLNFTVKSYSQAVMGETTLEGLTSIDEVYILRELPWNKGDCFKPSIVKQFQSTLRGKPLFESVNIEYSAQSTNGNEIPILIAIEERKHKTIKLGVGYESDAGPGVYGEWEHRNLFGQGEILNIFSTVNPLIQNIGSRFVNPYFYSEKRKLLLSSEFKHEDSEQYLSTSWLSSANIQYNVSTKLSYQYGIGFHLSEVTESAVTENYQLLFLPLNIKYDSRNDILDTKNGLLCSLSTAPYKNLSSPKIDFLKSRLDISAFWSANEHAYTTLAGRVALGSITAPSRKVVPADLRFYAGGGQSVRGYEYQKLGTVIGNEALGGRSLIEVSTEWRQKITETYGFVLFVDGGNVFDQKIPDLKTQLQWALGLGLRYYTSFGPVRFDLATPLNKRPGIDKSYQIYISLGQAY